MTKEGMLLSSPKKIIISEISIVGISMVHVYGIRKQNPQSFPYLNYS